MVVCRRPVNVARRLPFRRNEQWRRVVLIRGKVALTAISQTVL